MKDRAQLELEIKVLSLEEEVRKLQEIVLRLTEKVGDIDRDITYLFNKKED